MELRDTDMTASAESDELHGTFQPSSEEHDGEALGELSPSAEDSPTAADSFEDTASSDEEKPEKTDTAAYFDSLMAEDLRALKAEFPALHKLGSITELDNPKRYAQLRDLGLSPSEAYRASTARGISPDTRAHLTSAAPKFASTPRGMMSDAELSAARDIFDGMSDSEIKRLHKRVTS